MNDFIIHIGDFNKKCINSELIFILKTDNAVECVDNLEFHSVFRIYFS